MSVRTPRSEGFRLRGWAVYGLPMMAVSVYVLLLKDFSTWNRFERLFYTIFEIAVVPITIGLMIDWLTRARSAAGGVGGGPYVAGRANLGDKKSDERPYYGGEQQQQQQQQRRTAAFHETVEEPVGLRSHQPAAALEEASVVAPSSQVLQRGVSPSFGAEAAREPSPAQLQQQQQQYQQQQYQQQLQQQQEPAQQVQYQQQAESPAASSVGGYSATGGYPQTGAQFSSSAPLGASGQVAAPPVVAANSPQQFGVSSQPLTQRNSGPAYSDSFGAQQQYQQQAYSRAAPAQTAQSYSFGSTVDYSASGVKDL